jgi:hypothetical protein
MLNGKIVDNTGKITWYKDGLRHRTDGPAVEMTDGIKEWRVNDKLHREDGPAVEHSNGYKSWFTNGKRYLEAWYQNGLRHRTDGPAVECPDAVSYTHLTLPTM